MSKRTKTILSILAFLLILGFCIYLETDHRANRYAISIIQRCLIYAVVAVAMNLLTGFTGLFSLGQAGFMAIGAYVVGLFTMPLASRAAVFYTCTQNSFIAKTELPFPIALVLGGLAAALSAAIIGYPILRLKSDYLAIATLGFSEIVRSVIASPQLDTITNGSFGLKNIPSPEFIIPGTEIEVPSLINVLLISSLCILLMVLLINSSYGRAFKAIREDETAAEAMGINLAKHKRLSFIVSSFFTGVSGGLLAAYMGSIESGAFRINQTYDILLIVVLGGMGSVTGSVIGSFVVLAGREYLRFLDTPLTIGGVEIPLFRPGFRMVIFSILLMLVVLVFRKGLMGSREFSWDWFYHPKKTTTQEGGQDNG